MKTKLLFTIAGILLLSTFQVFSSIPAELNQEMPSETQFASGKVLTVKIHCQSIANNMLGDSETRRTSIYLPPGYDQNGNTNYPVIYMLSDFNGTNEDWFQTLGNADFISVLDKSIQSGNIKPAILVFPDGKNKIGGSWYTNSVVSGNWENFIVTDVVNYIDHNFRTLPFAASRGIAGKGMGGYGALKIATKHPDVFSAVYSLNALVDFESFITNEYIWSNSIKIASQATSYPTTDEFANRLLGMAVAFAPNSNKSAVKGDLPKTETGELVSEVFEKWLEQDPLQMIRKFTGNLKALKAINVDCSTSNAEIMLSANYADVLTSNGINHKFSYFAGNENSDILKRVMGVMLPMFSDNLANSLLEFECKPCYTYSDVLKLSLITDGDVYVVPFNYDDPHLSMNSNKVIESGVKANSVVEIPLANFDKGIYKIYGVSNSGFTGKSYVFGVNGGTPLVKICVTDCNTGEMITTCQMTVNGKQCIPNPNGEHCFNAEGNITICAKKENYGDLLKSATIYTDTIINISLVKDSYLQVIERNIGKPIFEAMVTQNNQATLTAASGLTTVKNLQNGRLECRIFKPGYFTETVNVPLEPGKTAVISLTPKKADVHFVLIGNEGHLADGFIVLGDLRLKPDEFGKASFTGLDTRVEYSYSIENASYKIVQNSFFLESDITLPIFLESSNVSSPQLKNNQLTTDINENIANEIHIYPNPATSNINIKTFITKNLTIELRTETGSLLYSSKIEGTLHRINLSNLSNGVYFVTVKSDNFYHTQKIMKL